MMMMMMMMMTAMTVCSSKPLLHILHTTLFCIPEHNIQKHGHKNLKNIISATVQCPYSNPKIIPEKY
jgi:hypothetical protein